MLMQRQPKQDAQGTTFRLKAKEKAQGHCDDDISKKIHTSRGWNSPKIAKCQQIQRLSDSNCMGEYMMR
jgi:hypothetical protein